VNDAPTCEGSAQRVRASATRPIDKWGWVGVTTCPTCSNETATYNHRRPARWLIGIHRTDGAIPAVPLDLLSRRKP